MPWLLLVPLVLLLLAGLAERALHVRRLRTIPIRILVNGTRGKTSTTRLIAAALNHGGVPAMAKCTGSDPREILPDGTEQQTQRPQGARITELFGFIKRAQALGVRAVVVECMAVLPETQQALSRHLVQPTITVITNAMADHIEELGETHAETARGLQWSLYPGTRLVTDEAYYAAWPSLAAADRAELPPGYLNRFRFPVYEHNIRLALAAAILAGVTREDALEGMLQARPDIGMAGPFTVGRSLVFNSFAANDPDSTAAGYARARAMAPKGADTVIIYNHRGDRAYRLQSFLPFFRGALGHGARLMVIGDNARRVCRSLSAKLKAPCRALDAADLLSPGFYREKQLVFCMGNINGPGADMVRYCMKQHKEPLDADSSLS